VSGIKGDADARTSDPQRLLKLFGAARLPVILQTEATECGLACLAMIASFHGHRVDLDALRARYSVSLKGIDLHGLMQLADRLHLATRAVRVELDELKNLRRPAVLHWDLDHFVVLKKVTARSITIHDPARGSHTLSLEEASRHFTGVALELVPTPGFERKKEERRARLSDFWQRMHGLRPILVQIIVLSMMLQLFALAAPFFMQLVIDEVVVSRDLGLLKVLAIGFALLMLVNTGVTVLRSLVIVNMGAQLNIQMANNLFRHLIRLPLSYFEKRHVGDIVSRFGSMDKIKELLTNEIVSAVVDGVMFIGTLAMMYVYSPLLASIVIVTVGLYALFRFAVYRPFRRLTEESIVADAKEDSNFLEGIRGAQSIKLFGKETQRQSSWQNLYADVINTNIRLDKLGIGYGAVNSILFGLENVIVIYLAAQLVIGNELSVGMIFAFMAYKGQFTDKATSLIEQIIELKMIGLHLARLGDIVMTETEKDVSDGARLSRFRGDIRLENLSFCYSEIESPVLDGVNLDIAAGESVCLVGPSGSGKSTLMKLMLGLLEPTTGRVLVDGRDIRQLGVRRYRAQVASVMQDDQLLSGSLADNISFFDPIAEPKKIETCAKLAVIHREIEQMPMGYHSLIGDMGTTLSGGQKQRVLLARALYKNPRILFLDESTAHLDVLLEKRINRNISRIRLTRVIIAHRPETIASADRVVMLSDGGCFEPYRGKRPAAPQRRSNRAG